MPDTTPVEGVALDDFIRARARLEHEPNDVEAVVSTLSLPGAHAWRRVEQVWRGRMADDKRLARIVEEYTGDYLRALRGEVEQDEDEDGGDDREGSPPEHEPERRDAAPHPVEIGPPPIVPLTPSYMQPPAVTPRWNAPALGYPPPAAPAVPASPAPPAPVAVSPPAIVAPASPRYFAPMPPLAPPVPPAPVASEPSPAKRGPSALAGTAPLDRERMFSLVQANPTPFAGSTSPERLQQLKAQQAKTHSDAEEQAPSRPNSSKHLQETMMLASGPGQPAPLGPAFMRSASPGMSVDRYAAFVAEMQVKGASSDLLSRYGIPTAGAIIALQAEQERRFAADPAARARFEERKAHFIGFMKPTGAR